MDPQRTLILALATVAANALFLLLCPPFVFPSRDAQQVDKAWFAMALSLVPFVWGFYLLFAYQNLKQRILAYVAIGIALVWVSISVGLLMRTMAERALYHTSEEHPSNPHPIPVNLAQHHVD